MGKVTFITGGARSGKSRFAESLLAGRDDVLYVATAIGFDDEMRDRIARHRQRRNPAWETIECYRDFGRVLPGRLAGRGHILLDCVTIMVSNLMVVDTDIDWDHADLDMVEMTAGTVRDEICGLMALAGDFDGETIIVSNEVGMGLVPPAPLGRHYRDIAGKINMIIASKSDAVYFMVSGIPMKIK